jgi:hypothetical protein
MYGSTLEKVTHSQIKAIFFALIIYGIMQSVRGGGILSEKDSGLKFYPVDQVWLIMKSIFEKKSYTISMGGINQKKEV